jgi:PAS domain S-box-containing protein
MTNIQVQNRINELELELNTLKSSKIVVQKSIDIDQRFNNLIAQSINPILILKGEDMIMEIANDAILKIFNVGKEALGKPLVEILPEMKDQPFIGLLLDVLHNHITHYGTEQPAFFIRENGEKETVYFDFVYNPYKENDGTVSGVLVYATEVTQQVVARKKAEESEQRFRSLVVQAPVAIGIYKGKDYIAEVVNELALQMLNVKVDFIGKPLFDELPELENQGLKIIMDNVMQSGTTYYGNELEFTIHKNNISTQGFYNLIIQQLKADNESATGIIIVASEVTEQVLARKKVEESEHRYHNLVYTSPYMIAIFKGKDTIIEIANDAIIETWGKGKDVIGKSLFEVLPEAAEQGFDKLIQNVYETGEPYYAYESPVTLIRNGKQELMHYNFIYQAQRNVQGEIEGVAILANEVTPQVEAKLKIIESEERFRLLADNMPLNVFLADATLEDNITYLNKNWLDFTKQTLNEATINGWFCFVHPDDIHLVKSVYEPAFKNKEAYTIPNFRIKRFDGEYRWFTFTAIPRYLPSGEYEGYMGVGIDINEHKVFEQQLIDEKIKAETSTKSKQQFLANMSHEIRTPLNSILGFANVLLKTELSNKQNDFVDAIKTSGNSLHVLINDILDLAKVDAGKMTFEKQPFEMNKSINAILHSFDLKIKEKNIQLISEYDIEIPQMLVGDSVRLNQIMLNLLSNAIKFTHKGKIILSIKIVNEEKENVNIEFSVIDTGIGIADDKINLIFNLFEQAEISTANSYGGTGLGLAIVKQLVEAQGGSISVNSKLGEGSTFGFVLPFGKTNMQKIEDVEIIKFDAEVKTLRILVAEDVALNQLLIKIILSDFGFEYDIVDNGKLAIEKLQTNSYDVILMDLQMPEMNGFESTEYIRKTMQNNIPIIALTADVTTVDVDKCKAFGMNDYISKPINENQLYSKIVEVVKRK